MLVGTGTMIVGAFSQSEEVKNAGIKIALYGTGTMTAGTLAALALPTP
jgi:hypothetical protein